VKGDWNPDGKGFRSVPEEHRPFMKAKQREFYMNMLTSMILAGLIVHGAAFLTTGVVPTAATAAQTGIYLSIAAVVSIGLGLLAK